MPAPETVLSNVIGAWRADTLAGSDLTDLSGNGRTLTGTGTTTDTTDTADGWGVAGKALVTSAGAGGQYFTAAAAAPWAPLHDGTGCTIWAVLRYTHTGKKILFDTGGQVTSTPGAYVWIDGDLERIGLDFTDNPSNSGRIIDFVNGARFSWKDSFTKDDPHVLVVVIRELSSPDIELYVDGHLVDSLSVGDREKGPSTTSGVIPDPNDGRDFASGAPGYPLRLFALANSVLFPFAGELAEFGCTSSAVPLADRAVIEDWAASNYGIILDRTPKGQLLWDGNSLVDNVWRTDQFPELVTPQLLEEQRNVMRAIAGLETNQMTTRSTKHVVPMYDPTLPFNILVAWEFVNEIANGVTKEDAYEHMVSYCQDARARGWKVVVGPMPPHIYTTESTFNWLRNQVIYNWREFADACARIDTDSVIGSWSAMVADWGGGSGPKLYRSDGVHFTALGNTLVAPYWVDAINTLLVEEDVSTTSTVGFGSTGFGISPYGLGTPAVYAGLGGSLLRDPNTGKSKGSRKIDPGTKDYVVDDYGRLEGMSDVHQLVLLAVSTDKGSAAMRSLGQSLRSIDRITPSLVYRVRSILLAAVQHLVDRGLIEVQDVTAEIVRSGVVRARLQWRDLTTGEDEETVI